jgi:hypothetical protein
MMEVRSSIIKASNYLDERYYPVSHHLFQAILFSAILLAAWFSSVQSNQHIVISGYTIPSLCMFKNITTLDCPGCGITRSFVFAVHGRLYESYIMHFWGIPLAAFLLFQIGYRFWRASGGSPLKFNPTFTRRFRFFVVLSVLLPWLGKTIITLLSGNIS